MGNVSLKVVEKVLNFFLKKGTNPLVNETVTELRVMTLHKSKTIKSFMLLFGFISSYRCYKVILLSSMEF